MPDATATAVVYLYWGPAGARPFERFVASWRATAPEWPHRLVIVAKNLSDAQTVGCERAASELDAATLRVSRGLDLASYREAAAAIDSAVLCFLNTGSEILADGWLRLLASALAQPGIGLVGTTGSHESLLDSTARPLRPVLGRWFPPSPNPHVRTSGFALRRELMLDLDWPLVTRKTGAWRLENGRRSITRQVQERGLSACVVGRDGHSYPTAEWAVSHTFRSGDQENLLIADNRTREYAVAPAAQRAVLRSAAWGP